MNASCFVTCLITQDQAESSARHFVAGGVLAAGDVNTHGELLGTSRRYQPFYIYSAMTVSDWTARSGIPGRGGDVAWTPASGRHQGHYPRLVNPIAWAGIGLSERVIGELGHRIEAHPEEYRIEAGAAADLPAPTREAIDDAQGRLRLRVHHDEQKACRARVSGDVRELKVHTRMEEESGELLYVPFYEVTFSYEGREFAVFVDGASGQASGSRPVSKNRVSLIVGIAAVLLLLLAAVLTQSAVRADGSDIGITAGESAGESAEMTAGESVAEGD